MTDSEEQTRLHARIPAEAGGRRVDQVLPTLFPDYSRSKLSQWIKEGLVTVDGETCQPKLRIVGGEEISLTPTREVVGDPHPQEMPLEVVHVDEHIIVINKPAGLVVHPAAGNPDGTLQNGLLFHFPDLATMPRAGIVHRLDKDTSGLLVVARSPLAHKSLVNQLQDRSMGRTYDTVVVGQVRVGGSVEAPIGRHRIDRKRMAVVTAGKPAVSHYEITERFVNFTRLNVRLESGRTHQIRVHMAHIKFPVLGDPVYLRRSSLRKGMAESLRTMLQQFQRQALHAARLRLVHPQSGECCEWSVEPPADHLALLDELRSSAAWDDQ